MRRRITMLGQRIRTARQALLGVSQAQLGLDAGITKDYKSASVRMNRYESGKANPDPETLEKIAKALGVPTAYLLTTDDELAALILAFDRMPAGKREALLKQLLPYLPDGLFPLKD